MDSNGQVVATADSGPDGRFTVALRPGDYRVMPTGVTGAVALPPGPVTVSVRATGYTTVTIRFASRLR
jgi:hypothetical protein